jgi:hypothetical protein
MNKIDRQIAEALGLLNAALKLLDNAEQHAAAAGVNHVIEMLQAGKNTASVIR